jgi:hypothetical protein
VRRDEKRAARQWRRFSVQRRNRRGYRCFTPERQIPKVKSRRADVSKYVVADTTDRALLAPRTRYLLGNWAALHDNQQSISVIHVDVEHAFPRNNISGVQWAWSRKRNRY